jgi:hypothetical protein
LAVAKLATARTATRRALGDREDNMLVKWAILAQQANFDGKESTWKEAGGGNVCFVFEIELGEVGVGLGLGVYVEGDWLDGWREGGMDGWWL